MLKPFSTKISAFYSLISAATGKSQSNFLLSRYHCLKNVKVLSPYLTHLRMASSYADAVCAINNLQTNSEVIAQRRKERNRRPGKNTYETIYHLKKIGIEVADLDSLNIIHVTGTKGKGSTCAMVESILRNSGYKTGFYSSPHILQLRERIRINGAPISEDKFAASFDKVYRALKANENNEEGIGMPSYFKFLTILAYSVFLEESVDVAVIEVGIGGRYDCTNVMEKPVVCGITTLDFDHMSVLGNTLEEIAWNKAGICKPYSPCITIPQPLNALTVLQRVADERLCSLYLAPPVNDYKWPSNEIKCGIPGRHQYWNITLAVQIVQVWLSQIRDKRSLSTFQTSTFQYKDQKTDTLHRIPVLPGFKVENNFIQGLERTKWPGRSQVLHAGRITYFLDGAHTPKSIEYCSEWFKSAAKVEQKNENVNPYRILVFHCTGDRQPDTLLPFLATCDFDTAVFCPSRVSKSLDPRSDQSNFTTNMEKEMKKVNKNHDYWIFLQRELKKMEQEGNSKTEMMKQWATVASSNHDSSLTSEVSCNGSGDDSLLETTKDSGFHTEEDDKTSLNEALPSDSSRSVMLESIEDCLNWIKNGDHNGNSSNDVQVLVTGSLHLVGGVVGFLDPNMND